MTRHDLIVLSKSMNNLYQLIMQSPDFDGLSVATIFWIGKVGGTLSGALHQIDKDLEAGVPPRIE